MMNSQRKTLRRRKMKTKRMMKRRKMMTRASTLKLRKKERI